MMILIIYTMIDERLTCVSVVERFSSSPRQDVQPPQLAPLTSSTSDNDTTPLRPQRLFVSITLQRHDSIDVLCRWM